MGMTSDSCYAADRAWLQTLAYCFKERCAADGVKESEYESRWVVLAANGMEVPSFKSMVPAVAPTVEVDADALWLNSTSLVNGDAYFTNHQTMSEFEFQEDMHVRLS